MSKLRQYSVVVIAFTLACNAPLAAAGPTSMRSSVTNKIEHLGQCFNTRVKQLTGRVTPHPDPSGTQIFFTDGHVNVSYDLERKWIISRRGDHARLCVKSFPTECPAGDTRGIEYAVTNLRTHMHWVAPDSEHGCGGA